MMQAVTSSAESGRPGPEAMGDGPVMTGLRVVLAEDDVLLREGLASLLERSGFDVAGRPVTARGCSGWPARPSRPGSGRHPDAAHPHH
jgi:serine/threonine-protein kinase PknK